MSFLFILSCNIYTIQIKTMHIKAINKAIITYSIKYRMHANKAKIKKHAINKIIVSKNAVKYLNKLL